VERHTHLRAVFVKALEEGAFDKLPSPVQTRGMLSNYATFLDLDVDGPSAFCRCVAGAAA
jgi:cytoskeletal protein RodZ